MFVEFTFEVYYLHVNVMECLLLLVADNNNYCINIAFDLDFKLHNNSRCVDQLYTFHFKFVIMHAVVIAILIATSLGHTKFV